MERIIDIYGHFANFDEMYDIDNSWFGRLLTKDYINFEGIVTDYYEREVYFVFGKLEDESINIIRCSETDLPKKYNARRIEKGKFEGECSAASIGAEVPLGDCKITIIPAEMTREDSKEERVRLKNRIKNVKDDITEEGRELYSEFTESLPPKIKQRQIKR